MHSSPSVEYPAGRSAFQARLDAVLALAWLATQACWWLALEGAALPGGRPRKGTRVARMPARAKHKARVMRKKR